MCVILQFTPYLLQSTWLQIVRILALISTFSAIDLPFYHFLNLKFALSSISFHIECNRLAILSFSNLKICVVLQFIPHLLHLWIFKLCVFLHLFPHWLQSTAILSFSNIKIVRYSSIQSLFIAIDLTSNCAYSCTYFHIQCNRLAILSFSNLEIVRCPAIHSTFVAINLTSDHLGIFKLFPLLHLFPHSLQLACPPIICEFSNCASSCT